MSSRSSVNRKHPPVFGRSCSQFLSATQLFFFVPSRVMLISLPFTVNKWFLRQSILSLLFHSVSPLAEEEGDGMIFFLCYVLWYRFFFLADFLNLLIMIFFHRVTAHPVLGVCRILGCVFASTDNSCSILLPQVSISLRIIGKLNFRKFGYSSKRI